MTIESMLLPLGTVVTLIKGSTYDGRSKHNPAHGVEGTIFKHIKMNLKYVTPSQLEEIGESIFTYRVKWSNGTVNSYNFKGDLMVVEPKQNRKELEAMGILSVSGDSTGGGTWMNRIVKARNNLGREHMLNVVIREGKFQHKNYALITKAVADLEECCNATLAIQVKKAH